MFLYKKEMDGIFFKDSKLLYFKNNDIVFHEIKINTEKDISANNTNIKSFVSDQKKIFVRFRYQFFHTILDTLSIILIEHERNPNVFFVINIDWHGNDINSTSHIKYVETVLKRNNIQYEFVKISEENPIEINNFLFFNMYPLHVKAIDAVAKEALKDSLVVNPNKKVYLSRAKLKTIKEEEVLFGGLDKSKFSSDSDQRIDNEEQLIEYFNYLGFEIIYTEDFFCMEEQINFFSQVKTIVSVTTAGLANAIFMPTGGKVIELTVPLITYGVESIHNVYQGISFAKKHKYMSLPTMRSAEDVISIIENDATVKDFICE